MIEYRVLFACGELTVIIADNTPVLVGSGQYVDRGEPGAASLSPADIAAEAARRALAATGANRPLAAHIEALAVARLFEHSVRGRVLWPNPFGASNNMPWSVANRLGVRPRRAIYSEVGGETPQRLVNGFAAAIHRGEMRAALVTGGEALATVRKGARAGVQLDWHEDVAGEFEDLWPDLEMTTEHETRHGIVYPIDVYGVFEQALRAELGLDPAAYRARIGRVFTRFAAVAAANEYAQFPTPRSAEEIATPSGENFLVSEPYTKWMVAQDAVNQGAAVVMMAAGLARELGIPQQHWVYLRSHADVDEQCILRRPRLATSAAQTLALRRALDDSGLAIEAIGFIDLYSCFPIAVTSACETLRLDPETGPTLTLTGGLPYFGGPGNNYSLHAIAEVVTRLRATREAHALVAANGGYLSKHSVGIYSNTLAAPWAPCSSAAEQRAARADTGIVVEENARGTGTIESYSASYARGAPANGYVIGRLHGSHHRFIALPADDAARRGLFEGEPIGREVTVVTTDGTSAFTMA